MRGRRLSIDRLPYHHGNTGVRNSASFTDPIIGMTLRLSRRSKNEAKRQAEFCWMGDVARARRAREKCFAASLFEEPLANRRIGGAFPYYELMTRGTKTILRISHCWEDEMLRIFLMAIVFSLMAAVVPASAQNGAGCTEWCRVNRCLGGSAGGAANPRCMNACVAACQAKMSKPK
jgi:hypothetical protein